MRRIDGSRSRTSLIGAVLLVASMPAPACNDVEPGGPRPTLVTPDEGFNDRETKIAILGTFHPLLRANFDDQSQAGVSTEFSARLNDSPLREVQFVGPTKLTAVVPAGLDPRIYNLVVKGPRGKQGVLNRAYTVRLFSPGHDAGLDLVVRDAEGLEAGPDAAQDGSPPDLTQQDLSAPDQQPPDSKPGPMVATIAGTGAKGFADGPATATSASARSPPGRLRPPRATGNRATSTARPRRPSSTSPPGSRWRAPAERSWSLTPATT
jgi:hypothetical protein